MKNTYHKSIKLFLLISLFLLSSLTIGISSFKPIEFREENQFLENISPNDAIKATNDYEMRRDIYLGDSNKSRGLNAQASRVYLSEPVIEEDIRGSFEKINNREDCADFSMNTLLRIMYLDKNTNILEPELRSEIKEVILNFKYWFTEPGEDSMIMWTENHMILFHTAELLAGQLYPDEIFPNSGMSGNDHIDHATPLVNRWLEWRFRFGFSEWHSNTYMDEDLFALLNLVDFAEENEMATKAAMLIDIIAFDFANNFFKGRYATTHGRAYDSKKVGTSVQDPPSRDSIAEFAWVILGLGYHQPGSGNSQSTVALVTSDNYNPPPILEAIAEDSLEGLEHKDRNSINLEDGPEYGFGYETEDDLMFWWPMSAVFASETIEASLNLTEYYNLDTKLVFEDPLLVDLLKFGANLYGMSISEFCEFLKEATQGVVMEEVNTYTYRTPYYQLSGAQDHQKGMGGYQEHIWQASLDENATVFTNSHGGFRGEDFTGGFNPRATFYKNTGILQYDRLSQSLILEFVYLFLEFKPITQAYFPRWAFDEVNQQGKWTFGRKGESYIALFSHNPTRWKSDYEMVSSGRKNAYIVELGSVEEFGTFENFTSQILASKVNIKPLAVGYSVAYESPTQGLVKVQWNGPMEVKGNQVDLGPYKRHDNKYCSQEFNSLTAKIEFNDQILELNFEEGTRTFSEV